MVQRRAARFLCNNYSREASVTAMLDELGWRSLKQRRTDQRLIMLYSGASAREARQRSTMGKKNW